MKATFAPANRLIVEEGAVFSGHVTVGPEAGKAGSGKPSVQVSRVARNMPPDRPAAAGESLSEEMLNAE